MGGTPISHRQELAGQAYSLRSRRVCGLRTERSEDVAKAGIAKFIWQRLCLQVGMGGTPISHRQELAGQAYSLRSRRVCGLRTERSEDVAKAGIAKFIWQRLYLQIYLAKAVLPIL